MIIAEKMILRKTDEVSKWLSEATAIYNIIKANPIENFLIEQNQEQLECIYSNDIIQFKEVDFKSFGIQIPNFLYHVTHAINREKIAKTGIQPMSQEKKLWKGCSDHYTYWARTLKEALRFVGDLDAKDLLLCYKCQLSKFNLNKLFVDRMFKWNFDQYNVPTTFEYHGGISAKNLILMKRDEAKEQLRYEEQHDSELYSFFD